MKFKLAEDLAFGDVMALPMGRTATILTVKPVRPNSRFVHVTTEYGPTRLNRGDEIMLEDSTETEES